MMAHSEMKRVCACVGVHLSTFLPNRGPWCHYTSTKWGQRNQEGTYSRSPLGKCFKSC